MKTVYNLVSTSLLAILGLTFPTQPVLAQEQSTADIRERVKQRAREVTVEFVYPDITGHKEGEGSGVLVYKEENTYYVLTAWHVFKQVNINTIDIVVSAITNNFNLGQGPNSHQIEGICIPGETQNIANEFNIDNICSEHQEHLDNEETIDAALVSFSCDNNECEDYIPIEIGNTSPGNLDKLTNEILLLSGFPNQVANSQNKMAPSENTNFSNNSMWSFSDVQVVPGKICPYSHPEESYLKPDLVYKDVDVNTNDSRIQNGFSGGVIVNANEQIIGMHIKPLTNKNNNTLFCGYSINTILEYFPQVQAEVPYSPPPENPNPVPAPSETEESAPPALW